MTHIENRRLFESASGRLKLVKWEQDHLHECKVCQGVFHVFLDQLLSPGSGNSGSTPDKPADAA